MKKIIILLILINYKSVLATESRFGELTEMFDPKMRGQENIWVRPHPGPFIWSNIEPKQGEFFWNDADEYVKYAQKHNQKILATIWPYAKWDQKTCNKKRKQKVLLGNIFLNA